MNPAPPKPPSKNANRKALAAYFSELRRWAEALKRWEADLDERERDFEDRFNQSDEEGSAKLKTVWDDENDHYGVDSDLLDDPIYSEDECDCTTAEAEAGCDCPACVEWRSRRAKKMMQRQQEAVKVGDEIQWLENLWNLPDKRRKK
jgi:hypothetical protein